MSGTRTIDYQRIAEETAAWQQAEEAKRRMEEEQERQRILATTLRGEQRARLAGLLSEHAQNLQEVRSRFGLDLDQALLARLSGSVESSRHRLTITDMTEQALKEVRKDVGWVETMTATLVQQAEAKRVRDLEARRSALIQRMRAFDDGGFDPQGHEAIHSDLLVLQVATGVEALEGAMAVSEDHFLAHVDRTEATRATQRAEVERLNQERLSLAAIAASHAGLPRPVRDRILRRCADVAGALLLPSFEKAEAILQSIREELATGVVGAIQAKSVRDDVIKGLRQALNEEFGVEPSPHIDGSLRMALPEGETIDISTWIEDGNPRVSAVFEGFHLHERGEGTSCGEIEDRIALLVSKALLKAGFEASSAPSWLRTKARKPFAFACAQDEECTSSQLRKACGNS